MMDIAKVEQQRSELLQLVLLLIIIFLGLVVFVAIQQDSGPLIPSLGVVSLLACLYVITKERSLKHLHSQLVEELVQKERKVSQLGKDLKEEHHQLDDANTQKIQLEGRLREVSMIYRSIRVVNAAEDPQRAPESVLRSALELVEADCGSVMLVDRPKAQLVLVAAQGLSEDVLAHPRRPITEGIAGWVVQHQEALLLNDAAREDPQLRALIRDDVKLRSAMSVPLQVRGQIIGVINFRLSESAKKQQFTEYDLRMVSLFAQNASVVIDNSRLIRALRQVQAGQKNGQSDAQGLHPQDLPIG